MGEIGRRQAPPRMAPGRSRREREVIVFRTMFTYIDPDVRTRLIRDGKLIRIDADGRRVEKDAALAAGSRSRCRSS